MANTSVDFTASVEGTFTLAIENADTKQGVSVAMTAAEVFALMAAMITVIGQYAEYGLAASAKRKPNPPSLFVPERRIIN